MQVTFATRYDGWLWYGGAETQAEQTSRALRSFNMEVDFFTPRTTHVGSLVHFFGMYEHFAPLARYCRQQHIPTVLSTIFYQRFNTPTAVWRALRWMTLSRLKQLRRSRFQLLWLTDMLLPNSRAEAQQLQRLFNIPIHRIEVIPNGVEARFAEADPCLFRERLNVQEEFVLNVGRVEDRKNQLRLVQAAQALGVPIIIIGQIASRRIYQQCLEVGKGLVRFLPPLAHDDPLLASAYAACRVFALPSLLETPGIAALEAGVAGARIVVTPVGGAREYFGGHAIYPKPRSVESIRDSLEQAWNRPHDPDAQRRHLLTHYSWERVAQRTLKVYQQLLQEPARCV
ncbi:MAG: glycosyltransferase family 4 protein [Fimbriimonadales bacterium]|nr:glycosyltransferase family 4 protein [Fimbriimonadales bacterium]